MYPLFVPKISSFDASQPFAVVWNDAERTTATRGAVKVDGISPGGSERARLRMVCTRC